MTDDERIAREIAARVKQLAPKFLGMKGRLIPAFDAIPGEYQALMIATVRVALDDGVIR